MSIGDWALAVYLIGTALTIGSIYDRFTRSEDLRESVQRIFSITPLSDRMIWVSITFIVFVLSLLWPWYWPSRMRRRMKGTKE